ncbi:MAG TPA: 16S rRNA (adenine(1518)-N(6)/adenine(1519)-N(6))-dimethyltransferase RsmA [Puia sp.]|nr:16S rRNA (adenine(1518)-N(6)/adenine(1519)-N(6))-dimethyltransferase RsmA [Puia sp.]
MFTIKKSLGQHFLHDENICRKIIAALRKSPFDQLLEVGPGTGALTKYLLEMEHIDFKAVEIDKDKIRFLLNQYPSLYNKLLENDFLEMEKPFAGKFTIVGNFPYNISSQIVFKVIDWKENVEGMIGMFQKEVALRIAAKHGNKAYGVISVLVQAFFQVEFLFEVSEKSFMPPPKIKSAVIRLSPRVEDLKVKEERKFFVLVKTAFNQRRKTLRNAVRSLFDELILQDEIFNKRAEQLSVEEFAMLTFKMKE